MADDIPDRIEKQIVIRAPRSRVWRALTDTREFNQWFGVALPGGFEPGKRIAGQITIPGWTHLSMAAWVERIEPEQYFSYRWHPFPEDPRINDSDEPTTLVEFRLEEVAGGTRLTVVESGFSRLPVARRGRAHEANSSGWEQQLRNIERHVAEHPSPRA